MIPKLQEREVESSGVTASSEFGISLKDSAHIMTILRDTLYSDKVLAVLREYGANAWDAHRDAGKKDVPIKITLPTASDPKLSIQDFGNGLSHEDVFQVYTQYGASTKRGSNVAVGMLGIGSKSGFAYSDSFTIAACHGGVRRTYVAVLDASEKGSIKLLFEEPCGTETGVLIQIPVQSKDIWEFTQKAQKLYKHFSPQPIINATLDPPPPQEAVLSHGTLYRNNSHEQEWVAIMGCVPYRVNLDQVRGPNAPGGGIGEHLNNLSGSLNFGIGEVQVSASREELKYGTPTKEALVKKFDLLVSEFVKKTLMEIDKDGLSPWDKRLRAQVLTDLKLPIPKAYKELTSRSVTFSPEPKTFVMTQNKYAVTRVDVLAWTRFIIRDDPRSLTGFGLTSGDMVVSPAEGATIAEAQDELEKLIKKNDLDGIPVIALSTLTWCAPYKPNYKKGPINQKHRVSTFKFKGVFSKPYSTRWDVEKRTPTAQDVYVILSGFKGHATGEQFYTHYGEDLALAKKFGGGAMPTVYGYKWTEKKPIEEKDILGVPYHKWRETFPASLLTPENKKMLDQWEWANILNSRGNFSTVSRLHKELGDHPLTLLVEFQKKGREYLRKHKGDESGLSDLSHRVYSEDRTCDALQYLKDVFKRYPLLEVVGINAPWGDNYKEWVEYIRLIDRADEGLIYED